ncbi:hypothetical protein O7635_00595 [Asanoa sp. WMMD1127]|uniref:hypothetical protein n=1 Tax=Asanoa sp. WMMD1127 TaxID=3016107 RepID=UPI00241719CE|nr:hypothetical protein [Asanoa sp. WMMD1127]MDG4820348.1 hypothetical protein [Asanoa sp. WMMD1127]
MAAPLLDPYLRTEAATVPSEGFQPGAWVWVHTLGSWRPGIVLHSSPHAATVRYRPAQGRGTSVDTVTSHALAPRKDEDPFLDHAPLTALR